MDTYGRLMERYGPQGWWPLLECKGTNPTRTGTIQGYHPGDYSYPRDERQRFEICVGAILTQNTAWPNVEKALRNLASRNALDAGRLLDMDAGALREAIRPSGYFNVKAEKLRGFARFHQSLGGARPARDDLLSVWGVGQETADSILLYAYGELHLVVDAYTRRILGHLRCVSAAAPYGTVKQYCEDRLPRDLRVYQEFHALLVEHAKRHYSRRPYLDPVLEQDRAQAPPVTSK